jgi:squalene cyclase
MGVGVKATKSVVSLPMAELGLILKMNKQSCEQSAWVEHENSQVVQTCWAVMSLMYARYPYPEPIEKGVRLVMSRQLPVSSRSFS